MCLLNVWMVAFKTTCIPAFKFLALTYATKLKSRSVYLCLVTIIQSLLFLTSFPGGPSGHLKWYIQTSLLPHSHDYKFIRQTGHTLTWILRIPIQVNSNPKLKHLVLKLKCEKIIATILTHSPIGKYFPVHYV